MKNFVLNTAAATVKALGSPVKHAAWIALLLLHCQVSPASALDMLEHERFYIYFPEGQSQLATSLLRACGPIAAFIRQHGLDVALPIHIVIDENLDKPGVTVDLLPHREIRIPLRAPGVLEDGANESDPWHYFLFMGLCSQAIYGERSGIPGTFHKVFGEISSPNLILPEWGVDGIAFLLYNKYCACAPRTPMAQSIFNAGPIPDLDKASNHPNVWPGRLSHRIYGRPFISWIDRKYGWDSVLKVLQLHGRGIIPVEIDDEARAVFGQSWDRIWKDFKLEYDGVVRNGASLPIVGYWSDPFVYWNDEGIYPGLQKRRIRSRYGYVDQKSWLHVSEFDSKGISRIRLLRNGSVLTAPSAHLWDPGPGDVAVSRKGRSPVLVLHATASLSTGDGESPAKAPAPMFIDAPPGVIQLSGPVADQKGRVAVAGNTDGNWDIWLYDSAWHRITTAQSIEMDPWLEDDRLVFSSNISGKFQIHSHDLRQLTDVPTAAVLPRQNAFLQLKTKGWLPSNLPISEIERLPTHFPTLATPQQPADARHAYEARPYSPLKSIWPNYIMPDLFVDPDNFQFGVSTAGEDVTKQFAWDGGIRYAPDKALFSWRLGGRAKNWHARTTRYPFGYTTSQLITVDEVRNDFKLGWSPGKMDALDISANWRYYTPQQNDAPPDEEWWGAISYRCASNNLRAQANVDLFAEDSQSLYGEVSYRFGQRISTVLHLMGGKTWGELKTGHNTFRIGGNSAEGYFTQRPTRLFPLRGFNSSILDAGQAATLGIETFWPLANLQAGYKSLPLFLHNISIGTFLDCGFASDHLTSDEILAGAGFELITGMELAWGFMADFRLGWAWPLRKPDDVTQEGAIFLIQIGRPL